MGWPFRPKKIRYQWFIWKKNDDWGYGSWTDWRTRKTSNTNNSAVAEEANVDEAITAEEKAINEMEIDLKY